MNEQDGSLPSFSVQNVNSHSLGVVGVDPSTGRKQTAVVIPRNTGLPVSGKRIFHTSKEDQRSIWIQIVEGESESPSDCVQIGHCTVSDLPPGLPAKTPVEVRFRYHENGRLSVRVRILGTERDLNYEIHRENSLSSEELRAWRARICGLPVDDQQGDGSESTFTATSDPF
jgi:molecular chaperone DnaK